MDKVVIMRSSFRSVGLSALLALLSVPLPAQITTLPLGNNELQHFEYRTWTVAGAVKTLQGDPVPGAVVEVRVSDVPGQARKLETDTQGQFSTEFRVNTTQARGFAVNVTATKRDFLPAHTYVDFGSSGKMWEIPITLRSKSEDSQLLTESALISSLVPRLEKLGTSDGLSPTEKQDYARGVEEFRDQDNPGRAMPFFAKVVRGDTSCAGCRTMLGLMKLASGDWDGAHRDLTEAAGVSLKDRTVGRPEPLLALGVMESWKHEPKQAAGFFLEALKFTPQDPLALQELGRSQLLLQNWGPASDYFAKALAAGAGREARLMRIQALVGIGDAEESEKEMTHYLTGRKVKDMPPDIRQLWMQVQDLQSRDSYENVASIVDEPLADLLTSMPELEGLEAATNQAPLGPILSAVGKNVLAFFKGFPNTTSLEQIHEERLRRNGKLANSLDQEFRYLLLSRPGFPGLGLEENRADREGRLVYPAGKESGFMVTKGFASLSLVFHPDYQAESAFRYLGAQMIDGHEAEVVAFAQKPKVARLVEFFVTPSKKVIVLTQGLAWIDSGTQQIIRMRTDLLKPQTRVRLEKQTAEIRFTQVHFKDNPQAFWLPSDVVVTLAFNGAMFRNQHEYSDFRLFLVGAEEKRQPLVPPVDNQNPAGPDSGAKPRP